MGDTVNSEQRKRLQYLKSRGDTEARKILNCVRHRHDVVHPYKPRFIPVTYNGHEPGEKVSGYTGDGLEMIYGQLGGNGSGCYYGSPFRFHYYKTKEHPGGTGEGFLYPQEDWIWRGLALLYMNKSTTLVVKP